MDTDSPVGVVFTCLQVVYYKFIYHLRNHPVASCMLWLFLFWMGLLRYWIVWTGCNLPLPGPEFLQDVQHIFWRSGHTWTAFCAPELMGNNDTIHWDYRHGPWWQQGSCSATKNCIRPGMFHTFNKKCLSLLFVS